ncbi:DUF1684 domain-containing protein [Frigoribacterium sp. PhB24]|uniref:DUF1684 domain-containing protein n=1 Tax=Frigoribacterium sp. PhB24 TaxID=2485204 RepID=UPI000F498333|nr:DUF1684 domain-containing protein [Frigoribacterium sp. PhB24]ROS54516.1 hypothetical protein EDF50_0604 [Frigoribacterium sp. PhB24]
MTDSIPETDGAPENDGTPETDLAQAELDRFQALRRARAVSSQGPLALIGTQWVDLEQTVWGAPGRWAPTPRGVSGLMLTATAADGIRVDGDLVDGTVVVAGDDALAPSGIRFSDTTTGTVIANDDHSSYALRVWDSASDAVTGFGSIDAFPFDPAWVVTADFVPTSPDATIDIRHQKDLELSRPKPLSGLIRFTRDGIDHELAAFPAGDGDRLQLVFGDATNGDSTYSVGRFLFPTPNGDGTITLDFNRAVLPPCAFSYAFNCPIPPARNRFAVAIEAGEKNVLDSAGRPLH